MSDIFDASDTFDHAFKAMERLYIGEDEGKQKDSNKQITISYNEIEFDTTKAYLIDGVWFPRSQCTVDEVKNLLELPKWLYNKKRKDIRENRSRLKQEVRERAKIRKIRKIEKEK